MDNFLDWLRDFGALVMETVSTLISQAPEFIAEYWEFVAVGLLIILLVVLLIVRAAGRRAPKAKAGDGKPKSPKPEKKGKQSTASYYEVEHRPVIVYRSSQQKDAEQEVEQEEETRKPEHSEPEQVPDGESEVEPDTEQQLAQQQDEMPETVDDEESSDTETEQQTAPEGPLAATEDLPRDSDTQQDEQGSELPEDDETTPDKEHEKQPAAPEQATDIDEYDEEEIPVAQEKPSQQVGTAPAVDPKFIPFLESDLANQVIHLFNNQGFPVEIFYQGQYGADMVAGEMNQVFIQVKDWKRKVPEYAIKEARQTADAKNCSKIVIVAPAFDGGAKRAARRSDVELWTKRTLKKQQRRFTFTSE